MPLYQRPPFWRVPRQRTDPEEVGGFFAQKKKGNNKQVTPGTPAGRELLRGDIIAKIDDYDARDLRHEDAQNLFKNASNQIRIVVQRGGSSSHLYSVPRASGSFVGRVPTPTFYHEYAEDVDREQQRGATQAPRSPIHNVSAQQQYRTPSPGMPPAAPWTGHGPESLPRTPLPPYYPVQQEGDYRTMMLSPSSQRTDDTIDESLNSQGTAGAGSSRSHVARNTSALQSATKMSVNHNFFPNGYQDPMHPEDEAVTNWPYRTTPLVLPGAKVRREPGPTESYLRHHPNPAMRAPPHHDYRDTLMRQKYVHKQFNSPINLYSDQNIANSIRQQTSPLPHRPTLLYDPAKSETFRALQEEGLGDQVQEVPTPVEHKVFTAPPNKRPAPTPKPKQPEAKPNGKQTTFVNSLHEEHIQQSNSFKRLMYNVLGDTEF